MVTLLNETILWWHWIVLGSILLILEMFTGTFIMLSLGIAAVITGVVDFGFDISFTSEILLWILFSITILWAWKRWVKIEDISKTGQSDHALDTQGTVTASIKPNGRGKVTFDTPVLGNTSWTATSAQSIEKNSRVKIVEIHGQLIEVEKI